MKGSVIESYLDYLVDNIYSYYVLLSKYFESDKCKEYNKDLLITYITDKLKNGRYKELLIKYETDEIEIVDLKQGVIVDKNIAQLLNLSIGINEIVVLSKNDFTVSHIIERVREKLEKLYSQDLVNGFKENEKIIKKQMTDEKKTLDKFWENLKNDKFSVKFRAIFSIENKKPCMLESHFSSKIEELSRETEEAINKTLIKYGVRDNLQLISLKEIEILLLKRFNNKKENSTIFVDLNPEFLNKASNIKKIQNVVNTEYFRKKINFKVNYDTLEKYEKQISELKNKYFSFSLNEILNIEKEKLNSLISYSFIEYEDYENFKDNVEYCKKKNINLIATNVYSDERINFCKKNGCNYFIKS